MNRKPIKASLGGKMNAKSKESLSPVKAKYVMDTLSSEITKAMDNREYRKSLEIKFKDIPSYAAVRSAAVLGEKIDENVRKSFAYLVKRADESLSLLSDIKKNSASSAKQAGNSYSNTETILKGISSHTELLKRLHTEISDSKKKSLTMMEAIRNEVVNLSNENTKAMKGLRTEIKDSFNKNLDSLNALGGSNAKVMEVIKKNTLENKANLQGAVADMKKTTEEQMGNINKQVMTMLSSVKKDMNSGINNFDTKVNSSIDKINTSVDEFKGKMANVKSELKVIVEEGNKETQTQLKAIGGGLAKQNEDGFSRLSSTLDDMVSRINEAMEKQEAMFNKAIDRMRTDVVDANATQLNEIKQNISAMADKNQEILDSFRADTEKYLKKEIADLRDTLSSIRADMEMQKHLLNSIADKIKR